LHWGQETKETRNSSICPLYGSLDSTVANNSVYSSSGERIYLGISNFVSGNIYNNPPMFKRIHKRINRPMIFITKPAVIEEKRIIFDLLQPYLHELSSFPGEEIDYKDGNGVYQYPYLDDYWSQSVRHPYLFLCDNEIAGFALVRKAEEHPAKHWEMAEFYVLPKFRRSGLATSCSIDIFEKHPGNWRIDFNKHNQSSRALWQKLVQRISTSDIKVGKLNASHNYISFSI